MRNEKQEPQYCFNINRFAGGYSSFMWMKALPPHGWRIGIFSRLCSQAGSGKRYPAILPAWPSHTFGVGLLRA